MRDLWKSCGRGSPSHKETERLADEMARPEGKARMGEENDSHSAKNSRGVSEMPS